MSPSFSAIAAALLFSVAIRLPAQRIATAPAEDGRTLRRMGNRAIPDNPTLIARSAKIDALPASAKKVEEALDLARLAEEGYLAPAMAQRVANTLTDALAGTPMPDQKGEPDAAYVELASLVRYAGASTTLKDPHLEAANALLDARTAALSNADFSLSDANHKKISLDSQRGKILLVNFRDEDCWPCRQELAYLNKIYGAFKDKGVMIVSITDAPMTKVMKDVDWNGIAFPVLFDGDGSVYKQFHVYRQPRTFVFDASGKLVAQSLGMRSGQQFLNMLAKAGLTN
jgi:peroxiredoxin